MTSPTFDPGAALRHLLRRELAAVRRSIAAYPDDASLWVHPKGLPNAGGTIGLHVAGNLQHFFGAILGQSGYVRNRDAEFSRRGVPRAEILADLDAAAIAIDRGMKAASPDRLAAPYPEKIGGQTVRTGDYLVHLLAHLAYHLGQLDFHRRMVTGDGSSINAIGVKELEAF